MARLRRTPFAAPRTIRGSLLALIAVALAPLVLFGVYDVVREYRLRRDAEVRSSAELARAVATAVDDFVDDLVGTEHAVGVSIARNGRTPRQIAEEMEGVRAEYPSVRDMSWLDVAGKVVASTEPRLVGKSLFARDYYQEIKAGADWRVSQLVRSVVDGRPAFVVARGVRSSRGLVGIVTVAVDAEAFGAILGERSGRGLTCVFDAAGTVVALRPSREVEWSERRRTSEHWGVQRALGGVETLGVFGSPLAGDPRMGALVPIRRIGWVALASRHLEDAIAPVRRAALVHAGVLLAVGLFALGGALALAREIAEPLRELEQRATSVRPDRTGGVPLRGPVEVRRVSRALDAMTASLAARRAELEATNQRLAESSRAAEQAAAAAAAYGAELEVVMAALPIGLVIASPDASLLRVNDRAREIVGGIPGGSRGSPDAFRGSPEEFLAGFEVSRPDGKALSKPELPLTRAFRGELVRGELLRVQRADRAAPPVWIAASTAPVRDAAGAVTRAVAVFLDVTQLRQLQEERETLMQTVSHDLRTPLHVIVGHAELLRRSGDGEVRRRGEAILGSASRMTRLIQDLVDAARFDAGQVALRAEPVDLAAFLVAWKERMTGALPVERVRMEEIGPVPAVFADPARLDQILSNLVSNAVKYSVSGTDVRVALRATPSAVRLSVADRGPGIDPDELPRVFERYYRGRGAARAEGLGLGLFITRKLVEAHGWGIEVESKAGAGSVFTVVIPFSGEKASRSSAA